MNASTVVDEELHEADRLRQWLLRSEKLDVPGRFEMEELAGSCQELLDSATGGLMKAQARRALMLLDDIREDRFPRMPIGHVVQQFRELRDYVAYLVEIIDDRDIRPARRPVFENRL